MLIICKSLSDMKFGQLMEVYSESNCENAWRLYPLEDRNVALFHAEQDFYTYLTDVFFSTAEATYYILEEAGRYCAALRMEPYKDGVLLEALETHPGHRHKGFAKLLIRQALGHVVALGCQCVYSHINKSNAASIRTHEACGFYKFADHAEYIDGTVTDNSYTYLYNKK